MQCDCQLSKPTTTTKTPSAISRRKEAMAVDGDMFGDMTLHSLPPLPSPGNLLAVPEQQPLAWRSLSAETAPELGSSNQRPACHTEHYPRSDMETISCPSHRRVTALPPSAKVTSTKWLTITAWQATAHPAVRLGPDSALRRTSRAQSRETESSRFPAPLPLPPSALAVTCAAGATWCQVHSLPNRLGETATQFSFLSGLVTARPEGNGPATPSGPHLEPLERHRPVLLTGF